MFASLASTSQVVHQKLVNVSRKSAPVSRGVLQVRFPKAAKNDVILRANPFLNCIGSSGHRHYRGH